MAEAAANISKTTAVTRWERAKSQIANLREAAEVAAQRLTIGGAAAGGGFGAGYLRGWGELNNKDMTIGDSTVTYTLAGGGAMALAGAVLSKPLGESAANVIFGLGIGMVAGELAFMGYDAGKKPPTP